ncbi:hypothetical protein HKD27_05815 [Gluconobacter sp. R75690]|uniref:hypothetical protein n=1 Tax=unclassified Gluconobacter TaxID=2644261 RepID=UPI00188A5C50|nr:MULTISPECIES: hypothetical protein [unclassified Gluconobacter]MBF0850441.1 hypothetical protein [Gluconobacter sp. R75690]MBF0879133.1 hypothetical protein [Gluconobacter sp. R75828]
MKRLFLMAGVLLPSLALAQSVPTMNPRVTLAGPQGLNAGMATKADVNKPVVSNPTISGPTPSVDNVDTTASADLGRWRWTNNNGTFGLSAVNDAQSAVNSVLSCTRNGATPTGCTFTVPITTPNGVFGQALNGDILGTWPNLYLAPNIKISSGATITNAAAPQLTLQSTLTSNPITFWQDTSGNGNFSTNSTNSMFAFYTANGALEVHDTGTDGAAKINLYGQGDSTPASIWQDTGGGLYMSPGSTNGSTSIYANGTGGIALYANHVQVHGTGSGATNGAVLDFFGPGKSSPGSIWQGSDSSMFIESQVDGSNVHIGAAGSGVVTVESTLRNAAMPTSAPSTGAHFVCVDDAGDMYRSDTACK